MKTLTHPLEIRIYESFVTSDHSSQTKFIAVQAKLQKTEAEKLAFASCLFGNSRHAYTSTNRVVAELAAKGYIAGSVVNIALSIMGVTEDQVRDFLD